MKNKYDQVMARIRYWYVRSQQPITLEDIHAFEQELGYSLPEDYRIFLMKYGLSSGDGDVCLQLVDEPEEMGTSVDVFYGLKSGDGYDLRERREAFRDRLPNYLLPFVAGSGGEYCLCLSGDNVGKVYWWFQEMGTVESEEDLELIAESFDAFMNSLVRAEE